MKSILCIGCFFLIANSSSVQDPRQLLLDSFNRQRAAIAKDQDIANMNELSWSGYLEKEAQNLTCEDLGYQTKTQIFFGIYDNQTGKILEALTPDKRNENEAEIGLDGLRFPGQTHVGCASHDCVYKSSDLKMAITGLCIIGPETNRSSELHGAPGSKCREQGKYGLCKPKKTGNKIKKKPKKALDEKAWVERMNNERILYANHFNIARMYELSWDPTLASKAAEMECEDLRKPGPDYSIMIFSDAKDFAILNQISSEEKEEELDTMGVQAMRIPGQTKMGCAFLDSECIKRTGLVKRFVGACLFGPETEFGDVKIGTPGSRCPNGKGPSGLCKPLPGGKKMDDDDDDDLVENEENEDNVSTSVFTNIALLFLVFIFF
ncbi:hypothetical protein B9Z55_012106 [Caenorhabditis nigoni]|uniref:SCP domain-containing protein n=1 Tax=Caenorhabditis nigoni TaxID=1611254 RepID=A0A2G5TVU5_9PELO|nr:hypothetical protein B9Z55_012106 [Caenorhabditis nigoni]